MAPLASMAFVPLLALAPGGNAPSSLGAELPPSQPVPIVGGEQTGELEYGAVVALLNSQSGLCTGTVVTPRLILTAAHCLSNLQFGATVDVFFGNELQFDMSTEAVSYGFHPDFCDDCREDIYDYGYVLLGTDFDPPDGFILPITDQAEWDEAMAIDSTITLVGFGEDPDAASPADSLGTKRHVETTVRRYSELGLEFFAGGGGMDSCQGDSGGPAIVTLADGTRRLVGITSRGSDPCGNGGFYGTPFPALTWVRDETGIDLLPEGCSEGDCLDLTPPSEEQGRCAVARPGRGSGIPWLLLPLLLLRPRRRGARVS
ncbi:MAG: S1 family peptidase [Myxococcota bacterium]